MSVFRIQICRYAEDTPRDSYGVEIKSHLGTQSLLRTNPTPICVAAGISVASSVPATRAVDGDPAAAVVMYQDPLWFTVVVCHEFRT